MLHVPEIGKFLWEYTIGMLIFLMSVLVLAGIVTKDIPLFTNSLLIMTVIVFISCIVGVIWRISKRCCQRGTNEIELTTTAILKPNHGNDSENSQAADCEGEFVVASTV
nr:hypothetical transcript [Hymenolepis microstoma]